ncbi:MAG TPA: hypothetical protein VMU14_02800 [Acidimicrobiales bacterium]|nr:hypothetical protein [Acidimicrobiales bacterium]
MAVDAAAHALRAAGVDAAPRPDAVSFSLDGVGHSLRIEPVAYCTGQRARELVATVGRPTLVVSEKITAEGRTVLSDAGWSWLDRRGRLHLRAPGVRVDVEVPSDLQVREVMRPDRVITGRSGLTIAYWLCQHPGASLSPTKDATSLALAPSTISTTVRRFTAAGLVDDGGAAVLPELFWELASAWRPERTWLLAVPEPPPRSGRDEEAPSWRRSGTSAALAYGAPLVATAGEPVELYVVGPVEISIAVREYGAAKPGHGLATVAVPPVSAVVAADRTLPLVGGWPAAPRLTVALDLALDRARGREVLESWSTPDAVWR